MLATAVIIPIKSFDDAKGRLATELNATERHQLAVYTATRVITAARPFPVFVVCDDDEVARFAHVHGATAIHQKNPGLNNAVQEGINAASEAEYSWAIIAHSDLPLASHFDHLLDESMLPTSIGLVSDQRNDGTNVMVIATDCPFEFHYGPDSFRLHREEATRRGYETRTINEPDLAVDIDTPEDLAHLPTGWQNSSV